MDTIFYKNGTKEVVTFKRQNRGKIFYKPCTSNFALVQSVSAEKVDKVVLSSGEEVSAAREKKNDRNVFVNILIVLGIGIGIIAVGFGLIILLYAIVQPW